MLLLSRLYLLLLLLWLLLIQLLYLFLYWSYVFKVHLLLPQSLSFAVVEKTAVVENAVVDVDPDAVIIAAVVVVVAAALPVFLHKE